MQKVMKMFEFGNEIDDNSPLCGIDEAGRGPLAGPMTMAGVIMTKEIDGLNDSKKLSEKRREHLFGLIVENSRLHLAVFDSRDIDSRGLSACLQDGLLQIKSALGIFTDRFLFDGKSSYGAAGIATMVKADSVVAEVSAASIVAKVIRDRMMRRYASVYQNYGFERNKGYGTREHIEAIERYGLTSLHRRSFTIRRIPGSIETADDSGLFGDIQ